MVQTKLSDVVVPEVFTRPSIERTAEKWDLIQSGIVSRPPTEGPGAIPIGEGKTITLPFFQDLSGEDNVWDDNDDIELNKITMEDDVAVVLTREKAWGATDLSAALSSGNPAEAILELVADYWLRRYQAVLIAEARGVLGTMAGESPVVNYLDIADASGALAFLDGESFIDATHTLGDRATELTAIAIHSNTEAWLLKNDLIEFTQDSEGRPSMRLFQNRVVVVDDTLPYLGSGKYLSLLFGQGAFTLVEDIVPTATEVARHPEKKGGTDALYTRRKFCLHARGIKWAPQSGTPAKVTPNNAELQTAANWDRVWESKNIRIVGIEHKIG